MAIIKPGSLVADIRGKCGDNVYSRGPGGAMVRSIGVIDSEDTDARAAMRANLEAVAGAWSGTLTQTQRSAWRTYALTNLRPNRWGTPTNHAGFVEFVRHNMHAYRAAGSLQFPDAPTAGPLHPPLLAIALRTSAAVVMTGTLTPDATGTYMPTGIYTGNPYWQCTTPSGIRYIWKYTTYWLNTITLGNPAGAYWYHGSTIPGSCNPGGGATGTATAAWATGATLARITCPPTNYPDPPAQLTIHTFAGIEITPGRNYYSGPWKWAGTLSPPIPAAAGYGYAVWPFTIAAGQAARAYAVAQDADTVAISTKAFLQTTLEAFEP